MECRRCRGYMVANALIDLRDDAGRIGFSTWRCISCGEIVDPVILRNRRRGPFTVTHPLLPVRRLKHKRQRLR